MNKNIFGRWRITHMDEWDMDFVDFQAPGYLEFKKDGTGMFQFGSVLGWMDCRDEENEKRLDFSWEGNDEMNPASGRG